jgi:hypothetical protein
MSTVAMERVLDSFYERIRAPSSHDGLAPEPDFMKVLCNIYGLKHSAYIDLPLIFHPATTGAL